MSLSLVPITQNGNWPYVEVNYYSYGDAGGLFIETQGAVIEDVHADGVYDYSDAEFADINGDLHGKVFSTLAAPYLTTPYYMFSIKHDNDIGIVSPYCASSPTMPGGLQIYAYDAVHGMPTGSPSTVTFGAVSGSNLSTIVSLAKIGSEYYAMHLVYKRTVYGVPGEIALWGVRHNVSGEIISATYIRNVLTFAALKKPTITVEDRGYATQNNWMLRIGAASVVWA